MATDPWSLKHYKSHLFEIKSMQPGSQIYVSIDHFLLAIIMLKQAKTSSVITLTLSCLALSLVLQNVISMHAGKVLNSSCAGKHGARYKTNFITLKAVLNFQTLMLATLGKWATTHNRVTFLVKNCSWTLLPGSTWLQMPITHITELRWKLQNTFCFFKTCWRLTGLSRLHDAFQPPGRLQGT